MIRLHPARGGGTSWTGQRLARSPLSSLELVIDEGSSIRSRPMGLQDPNRLLRRSVAIRWRSRRFRHRVLRLSYFVCLGQSGGASDGSPSWHRLSPRPRAAPTPLWSTSHDVGQLVWLGGVPQHMC
jgi:hypothetical protein